MLGRPGPGVPTGRRCFAVFGKDAPANTTGGGFVEAVAGAYEAGLEVAFVGLFAGEARRRISLPIYPFRAPALLVPFRDREGVTNDFK